MLFPKVYSNVALKHPKSFNFFQNLNFSLPFPQRPNKKCQICNFIPFKGKETPNSSKRDVIMSFGANKLNNLFPFVRTLRTTGTQCRFILFVNNKSLTRYPELFYQLAKDCGVEFINFGSVSFTKMQAMFLRFCFYQKFLIQNKDIIDRVIFCDLYDTIFQHDPFTTNFSNFLYLTSEVYSFHRVSSNRKWIEESFTHFSKVYDPILSYLFTEKFKKDVLKKEAINGGLQAGPIKIMIEFSTAMMKIGNKETFEVYCNDQGFIGALVYSGYFKNKFNYSILKLDSEFMQSIHFYCFTHINRNNRTYELGKIDRFGGVASVLHQFDRSKKLKNITLKACPNDYKFNDYIRM